LFFYLLDYCTNLTRVNKLGTRNGTHKQTQERLKKGKQKIKQLGNGEGGRGRGGTYCGEEKSSRKNKNGWTKN